MRTTRFDLVIVGGGICGAGIAHEAAAKGLKVALVERGDFASGTSSKSSKLLHGGLRYLEQFRFGLVQEALRERNRLFDDAPHVARELSFLYPLEQGQSLALAQARLGILVYDALSMLSGWKTTQYHRLLGPQEVRAREPSLSQADILAALEYVDGITDDARLVVEVLKAALQSSATIANYCEAIGFLHDRSGRVIGVQVLDTISGNTVELHALLVVNAAGPWIDVVNRLAEPDSKRRLMPTKGVHVVVPSLSTSALAIKSLPHPDGRRRWMFVIPWGGRSLIGTTDTAHEPVGSEDTFLDEGAYATAQDVAYLIGSVKAACPGVQLTSRDVIGAYAGWRPLLAPADPPDSQVFESDISREHEIFETASGILCLAGGKLTTYRVMAREVIDRAVRIMRRQGLPHGPLRANAAVIPYGGARRASLKAQVETQSEGLRPTDRETIHRLADVYGTGFNAVWQLIQARPNLANPLRHVSPLCAALRGQVVHAIRHEGALTISDVLARRLRLQLTDHSQGLSCVEEVAVIAATELADLLGWDTQRRSRWEKEQVEAYTTEVKRSRTFLDTPEPPNSESR